MKYNLISKKVALLLGLAALFAATSSEAQDSAVSIKVENSVVSINGYSLGQTCSNDFNGRSAGGFPLKEIQLERPYRMSMTCGHDGKIQSIAVSADDTQSFMSLKKLVEIKMKRPADHVDTVPPMWMWNFTNGYALLDGFVDEGSSLITSGHFSLMRSQ